MTTHGEPIGLVDLTVYLRQFSILIESGVSLIRCLHVLQQGITFEPLREANTDIIKQNEGGQTLSKSMCSHPHLFTPFLIGLVRTGEVGGVRDLTRERAPGFYQGQLEHRRQRFIQYAAAQVLGQECESKYETVIEESQLKLQLEYFCAMLGTMLGSGVPILQAMEVAAGSLPERLAAGVLQAREDLRDQQSIAPALAAVGFPPGVVTLFSIGEETGALDRLAQRAADLLEAEIEGRLQAALGLN